MMELMDAANIAMVFIGIESPNAESLHETKKYQNVRKSATSSIASAKSKTPASKFCAA